VGRTRLRGGQRGQLPRAPRWKGARRDNIYLLQMKYSLEKFSWFRSDAGIQLHIIFLCYVKYKGPRQLISLQVWLSTIATEKPVIATEKPKMRGRKLKWEEMWKKQEPCQHQICRQNIRHQNFAWEHHIWCHVKISEVATLVSTIPNFWCSLEVAATELHLCFVTNGNVWWKRTFLPMVTIVVLHHKHMKLFKSFTPPVIAWSVRKGFNQLIRRTKEQKTRLQCLACAIPKPVMPSRAMKSAKLLRRKSARIWQC